MRELGIFLAIGGIFLAAAFLVELIVNRNPLIVAVAVTILGFAGLLIWDWDLINSEYSAVFVELHAMIAILSFAPSLAGAGLARFVRRRNADQHASDNANLAEE
jgi:predicted tellurium resistance membrane protein TerC